MGEPPDPVQRSQDRGGHRTRPARSSSTTRFVNGGFGDVRSILSRLREAGQPVLDGQCAMHHQANFHAANWAEGINVAPDGDVWAFMTAAD